MWTTALCLSAAATFTTPVRAEQQVRPIKPALQAFDLPDVTLGDGILLREAQADRQYLHDLDSDRLLLNFRRNAGLPAPGQPLGGWEAPDGELRGHFVGHYLSACALMYKSAGDKALKAKADAMVAELARCQDKLGNGYLSAFPESFFDRVEARKQVWAPYYTIHKIMAGLVDMYTYCGNKQALDVAEKMAAYFKKRNDKLSDDQFNAMLGAEFGGMANTLYDLYAINHRADDLALAHRFDQQSFLHPLSEDVDEHSHIHANTHIPKVLGAARRYELLGDPGYGKLTGFFWDRVVNHRSYATGGSNAGEGWGPPDKLAHTLLKGWFSNQETCTTYNMLKVTRDLIRWTGDSKYADFYEKAYWNGIVEAQNPANGMIIYYTPLAAGAKKEWSTPNDSFWCCSGTGVESFAKLGDSIYFHDADNLYVNLYAASTVNWRAKKVKVEQVTTFPEEQGSTFIVHAGRPAKFTLNLHIPLWTGPRRSLTMPPATTTAESLATGPRPPLTMPPSTTTEESLATGDGARITVNGQAANTKIEAGKYAAIARTWKDGDKVTISLPMSLHSQAMPDDPNVEAVMYGPLVLTGVSTGKVPYAPYDKTIGLLKSDSQDPATWLRPVAGKPLTFETVGQSSSTTFIPLYHVIDQTYTTYWTVNTPGSPVAAKIAAFEEAEKVRLAKYVDVVQPNDAESEAAHNVKSEGSNTGNVGDHGWRDGAWFEWTLKNQPGARLVITYWGQDNGRTFDVLVNGQKVATETLKGGKPANTFDVEYPIPADLQSANEITVRFQAHPGSNAGGVFGLAMMK